MAYPVLAPRQTWFTQGNPSKTRDHFANIFIMDSIPDVVFRDNEWWDASELLDGSVVCCITGDNLIIGGNNSGGIALNSDSSGLFREFYNVKNISSADLLDTSNVENFAFAFSGRLGEGGEMSLQYVDVSKWNTSRCTNTQAMFLQCVELETIDVSAWDMSNVTNMAQMFWGCNKLKKLDVSRWDVGSLSGGNSLMGTFGYCTIITELDISKWKFNPEATDWMFVLTFAGLNNIKELDLTPIPFDKATYVMNMFSYLTSVETLKLPGPKLGNIASFSNWFSGCSALKNLDTSDWDTHSCEDMSFMFYGCSGLKEIDVSKWDTSKVKNFDHFAAHALLRRKGIENWNTSSATNMNAMFHNTAEEELDLSGYDTSNVQFFTQMFENSPNLKHIKGLNKWDTSNATGFDQMFGRCYALEELDLSSFDTRKACNGIQASANGHKTGTLQNFVNDCRNLKWIALGPNFAVNGDGTNTTAANMLILPTPSTDYIEGADGLWRTVDGITYTPTGIPDLTAATYYSSYNGVADVDVIVKNGSLLDTARAIREVSGGADRYTPAQFGAAIRALGVALNAVADEIIETQGDHIDGGESDDITE